MPTSFPPVSKAEWLAKVTRDLKGKSLSDLDFTVAGLRLSPFHHDEDHPDPPAPLLPPRAEPCAVGVALPAENPRTTNKLLLDQLNKGANAVFLYADDHDPGARLDDYLKDVYRDIIDVYLMHGDRHYAPDYALFTDHDDTPTDEVPLRSAARMLLRYESTLLSVPYPTPASAPEKKAKPPAFWLTVNDDYLTNVAFLRAFRLCYRQLAAVYGPVRPARLVADPFTLTDDKYGGMVATTAVVMSAVIGGADVVFVPHGAAADEREETFLRRVALNTTNILHHEAHLDRVADPAAGSYYLETLTDRLATALWDELLALRDQNPAEA